MSLRNAPWGWYHRQWEPPPLMIEHLETVEAQRGQK